MGIGCIGWLADVWANSRATLRAPLSGTFLQGRKDVVNQCLEFAAEPQSEWTDGYLKNGWLSAGSWVMQELMFIKWLIRECRLLTGVCWSFWRVQPWTVAAVLSRPPFSLPLSCLQASLRASWVVCNHASVTIRRFQCQGTAASCPP